MLHVDLCVIGSGPGGQKAAICAAKLGKSVCVVERMEFVGGVAINTGTIPSKALREAVLAATGARLLVPMHSDGPINRDTQLEQLTSACHRVIGAEIALVREHFRSNGVVVLTGHGSLTDANTVKVDGPRGVETVHADNILIAVGTSPSKPANVEFDRTNIITSD